MAVEFQGILGGPERGFISTCFLQQHRAEGHQFPLVSSAKSVGNDLQECLGAFLGRDAWVPW